MIILLCEEGGRLMGCPLTGSLKKDICAKISTKTFGHLLDELCILQSGYISVLCFPTFVLFLTYCRIRSTSLPISLLT